TPTARSWTGITTSPAKVNKPAAGGADFRASLSLSHDGQHRGRGAAGAELVALDSDGGTPILRPDYAPLCHKLQRTGAVQPCRPVHRKLHHAADRKLVLSGEQNPPAAHIQRGAGPCDLQVFRLHNPVPQILLNREPGGSSSIRGRF